MTDREHISVTWLERTVMDELAELGGGIDEARDDIERVIATLERNTAKQNELVDAYNQNNAKLNELVAAYNKLAVGLPSAIDKLIASLRTPTATPSPLANVVKPSGKKKQRRHHARNGRTASTKAAQ